MLTHIFSKGNDGKKKREHVDYVAVGDGQAARSCLLELSVLNLKKKKKKKKTSTKIFFWNKDLNFLSRVYKVNPTYPSTVLKRFGVSRKDMKSRMQFSDFISE